LGGAIAHVVARRDAARSITLVDDAGQVAAGKALDIAQAAPVERFATRLAGRTDLASAAGASVVVIADRAGDRGEWQGEDGLMLLDRLRGFARSAIVICAGAMQRELVDRGVRELKIPRARLVGSAPEALASAARALVALAVNGSPRTVTLTVLGLPPSHVVIPWQDAAADGFALVRTIDEPARRQLAARIGALWPPGPHALAAAAASAIQRIGGTSRGTMSCFVAPEPGAGTRMRTAAMQVRLGAAGIEAVTTPELTSVERVALENAVMV
jgi:malate dehydrogenase